MKLETRARPQGEQRCPYCHDHLEVEVEVEAAITCPACGTEHHAACVRELGRCTTMGCERPLEVDEGVYSVDPAIRREIRRRFRRRAKRFVERNVRPVAPLGVSLPLTDASSAPEEAVSPERAAYFREARRDVERALDQGELEHALAAWERVQRLWDQLPPRVRSRLYAEQAELGERLRAARRRHVEEEVLLPGRRAAALGDALAWGLAGGILIGLPLFLAVVLVLIEVRHFAWSLPLTVLAGFVAGVLGYRESPHRQREE